MFRPGFRIIKQASLSHWVAEYNLTFLKVSSVNYQKPRSPSKQHPIIFLTSRALLSKKPKIILRQRITSTGINYIRSTDHNYCKDVLFTKK